MSTASPLQSAVYVTPINGGTVQAPDYCDNLILTPAGSLSSLTIVFPPKPDGGQIFTIQSMQVIIGLTLQAAVGVTIQHGLPTPALGTQTAHSWMYSDGSSPGSPAKTWIAKT